MSSRRFIGIAAALVLILAGSEAGAVNAGPPGPGSPSDDSVRTLAAFDTLIALQDPAVYWARVAPGHSYERFDSLAEMTRSADLVVVGTPKGIEAGRDLVADEDAGIIAAYATLDIEVESLIAGNRLDDGGPTIHVEFFIDEPDSYELFERTWPAERVMLFLRNKGIEAESLGQPAESPGAGYDYYRVVSEEGVFRDVDGETAVPVAREAEWLHDAQHLSFDDLVSQVHNAAAG